MQPIKPTSSATESRSSPGLKPSAASGQQVSDSTRQWQLAGLAALVLTLGFGKPLWNLILFTTTEQNSGLSSYILLIPLICGYLLWVKRGDLLSFSPPPRMVAGLFLAAGFATLSAYWLLFRGDLQSHQDIYLAIMTISYLLLLAGVLCLFLGVNTLRAAAFPLGFLIFLVPIPAFLLTGIDNLLQNGSAAVAWFFFKLAGTPVIPNGLVFQLPGITIKIAPECSGIRSTLVLFITSLLASYLFLRTPWKRAAFVLLAIPLGILRNGFRVFTIGELCEHIGPQMINSPIHHKGGPIFFVLALIPLFVILILLQKSEHAFAGIKSGHE